MKITMKRLLVVVLALAVAGGIFGIAALANSAKDTEPTIVYDLASNEFSFENADKYELTDGAHWDNDLFNGNFKDMYPGDSA